ncbi:hypothetical protein ACHAXR_008046 [Thalassiosira sp. AJA248-18]
MYTNQYNPVKRGPAKPTSSKNLDAQPCFTPRLIASATFQFGLATSFLSGQRVLVMRWPPMETKMIPMIGGAAPPMKILMSPPPIIEKPDRQKKSEEAKANTESFDALRCILAHFVGPVVKIDPSNANLKIDNDADREYNIDEQDAPPLVPRLLLIQTPHAEGINRNETEMPNCLN